MSMAEATVFGFGLGFRVSAVAAELADHVDISLPYESCFGQGQAELAGKSGLRHSHSML